MVGPGPVSSKRFIKLVANYFKTCQLQLPGAGWWCPLIPLLFRKGLARHLLPPT